MRALALLLALAGALLAVPVAAATPSPRPSAKAPLVLHTPTPPKVAEHAEFLVEVNKKGQVVRITHAKGTGDKDQIFNAWTYGNVSQIWIRHPDGSAEVGLYRVTYDYDPHTKKITRHQYLVQPGGDWGNEEGRADVIMETAEREAREHQAVEQQKQQAQNKNLPPLNTIVAPTTSPTHRP
ncbi:MAG: hypothetical protein ABR949_02060 [Candidatus Aquilonibacter sp.]|jgi:hypothetical protein